MTKILDFLTNKGIISMSVILSAITFGFVSKLIQYIYDPIFEYAFPVKKIKNYYIELPNNSRIELGLTLLEVIKVLLYLVITYHSLKTVINYKAHFHLH
jgi:large-conductance mechanosensitive channel